MLFRQLGGFMLGVLILAWAAQWQTLPAAAAPGSSAAEADAARPKKERSKPAKKKQPGKKKQAEGDKSSQDAADGAAVKKEAEKPDSARKEDAADAPKPETSEVDAAKPATVKVVREDLKIEVSLDGVFEAQKAAEISLKPLEWQSLNVLSAVEHGSRVKRGDVLVTFDLEKIDRAIDDLRNEQRVAELALKQAEQELKSLEATTPLDLAAAERARRTAEEDKERFFSVGKPRSLEMAEFNLKQSRERLEYAEEELAQLEKMYKADDLTEETEEIVLRRARNSVESARMMVKNAEFDFEETTKLQVPRQEERIVETTERARTGADKSAVLVPLALDRARFDLERQKLARQRGEERLSRLLEDRAALVVKAPFDGIAYHGAMDRGRWSGSSLSDELRRGGNIPPGKVIMTVVEPRPMTVRCSLPEKQLNEVKAGMKATVEPAATPLLRLDAIVDRVSDVPVTPGNFDVRLTASLGERAECLMPGMTCKVKIVSYEKKDALVLPLSAVVVDEKDADKGYVYVPGDDGKPQKRGIKIGRRTEKLVEVLAGIAEGGEVNKEAPNSGGSARKPVDAPQNGKPSNGKPQE
ncbi:MAG: efflux RND transporter periplasmic adaptor subunit [Planctomycetota bacterium]